MPPQVKPLPGPPQKFQGRKDYPIENKTDDWGLNPEAQETYVEVFRQKLEALGLWKPEIDFFTLRRFLRARTYDFDKAIKMWTDHVHWRRENNVDTILQDFHFDERDKFLDAYPQGYHKLDKVGRPVYIQLIGKINVPAIMKCTDEERMFKFHVQEYERCVKVIMPIASKLAGRKVDQTFGIMDVKGVGMSALTGDVKRMLGKFTKTDQDNYPEMLGHICIINAPAVFRMLWGIVKNMIDVRTQQKIEILGPNYMEALLKHMEIENIPEFLGGQSRGTLLDDVGPWSDPELMAANGIDVEALRRGDPAGAAPGPGLAAPTFGRTPSRLNSALGPMGSMFRTPTVGRTSLEANGAGPSAAASGPSAMLAASAAATVAQLQAIAENRSRSLQERVKVLENMLPTALERARPQAATDVSVRSAPEGSLLNRVEVLEDAVETVLLAQEALIIQAQQQAQLTETALADLRNRVATAEAKASSAKAGCCTIM
ncbi:hypothetical protein HYH02_001712 [Chlamydomonas schloesseri]|uniref:CRAL-TRIO domain-containing protein n=2 Tax=Chlamydomonas schloesseri TaxID=2026947 RepID=A0A835WT53_9CHLO|nr:hypothetical protein HYH02_001712 [Chlamydomonas schloesseri]|eukprot:KAG2453492.1 hypothetical protein HYH02_001712 [Chlamydomonas schloesseri]